MKCALCENKICYEGKNYTKIKDNIISGYLGNENKRLRGRLYFILQ